jgi:hypothetical protein
MPSVHDHVDGALDQKEQAASRFAFRQYGVTFLKGEGREAAQSFKHTIRIHYGHPGGSSCGSGGLDEIGTPDL